MKHMRKILAGLSSCAMLLSGMAWNGLMASAETEGTYGSLTYVNYGEYIEITDCAEDVTTVEIPAEIDGVPVTTVDAYSFEYCESLSEITVNADSTYFCSVDGILFSADKTVLVEYPQAKAGDSYTVPEGVTELGEYCFSCSKNLLSVTIPEKVTTIGRSAFCDCWNLKTVILPEGLREIPSNAFAFCYDLTDLKIPSTVTTIGGWAFCYCEALAEIVLPEGLTSLDTAVFQGCTAMTSITIPESITSLSYLLFTNCEGLTSVYLPSSITYISGKIFEDCTSIKDVYFDGLQTDWEAIVVDDNNEILSTCNIHFSDGTVLEGMAAPTPSGLGDLNGDSSIDANDATTLLIAAAQAGAGLDSGLTDAQIAAADLNGDGTYDANDATLILQYAAQAGAGTAGTIEDFLASKLA